MGERLVSEGSFHPLPTGGVFGFKLDLPQAGEYVFLAGCDQDCSAETISVTAPDNVDIDQVSGPHPNVPFHVPERGI
jgi:hypothetical protein